MFTHTQNIHTHTHTHTGTLRDDGEYMHALAVVKKELSIAKALLYVRDRTRPMLQLDAHTPSLTPQDRRAMPTAHSASGSQPNIGGRGGGGGDAAGGGTGQEGAGRGRGHVRTRGAFASPGGGTGVADESDDDDLEVLDWDAAEQMALQLSPVKALDSPPVKAAAIEKPPPAAAPAATTASDGAPALATAPAPTATGWDDDDAPIITLPSAGVVASTPSPAANASKAQVEQCALFAGRAGVSERDKDVTQATRSAREARRLGFDCPGPQSKWIVEAASAISPNRTNSSKRAHSASQSKGIEKPASTISPPPRFKRRNVAVLSADAPQNMFSDSALAAVEGSPTRAESGTDLETKTKKPRASHSASGRPSDVASDMPVLAGLFCFRV
jgi:hypothetical protein